MQPVKLYQCEKRCGFRGVLSSRSGIEERNRKLLVLMLVGFSLAAGIVTAKMVAESVATSFDQTSEE